MAAVKLAAGGPAGDRRFLIVGDEPVCLLGKSDQQAALQGGAGHRLLLRPTALLPELRPPIPVFSREVAEDFSLQGRRIRKGTLLVAHIGYTHQRRAEREKRQTILNLPGKGVMVVFRGMIGR